MSITPLRRLYGASRERTGNTRFTSSFTKEPPWCRPILLLSLQSEYPLSDHQPKLLANCLAQTEALLRGKDAAAVERELQSKNYSLAQIAQLTPHRVFPGNRASNTLFMNRLEPKTLGALVAAYEHKVFVQGIIWNINSFDQWGVELGKQLASQILSEFEVGAMGVQHDSSTRAAIAMINAKC